MGYGKMRLDGRSESGENLGGAAGKINPGRLTPAPGYKDLAPSYASGDPGSQRFGRGLLGCKAAREMGGGITAVESILDLFPRKNSIEKSAAPSLQRSTNPGDLDDVGANSVDHACSATDSECRGARKVNMSPLALAQTGKYRMNVLPSPGSLLTSMRPLCAAIMP